MSACYRYLQTDRIKEARVRAHDRNVLPKPNDATLHKHQMRIAAAWLLTSLPG
jgi:hypothetical protein